jgi:RNA polymerase-binding protein DksA
MEEKNSKSFFPLTVLKPLVSYLKGEEKRLHKAKNDLKKEDPFIVGNRDEDNSVDADVAENVDHERSSAMRSQVTKSLIEIRKTLTRIKLGKYGLCANCGKMIDTDRLAIKPTAEYCVECEKKVESRGL